MMVAIWLYISLITLLGMYCFWLWWDAECQNVWVGYLCLSLLLNAWGTFCFTWGTIL